MVKDSEKEDLKEKERLKKVKSLSREECVKQWKLEVSKIADKFDNLCVDIG
jgi:hypothetical protein